MASTYVNDLRLNEMATGDASGTWGTTTNTNLELIGEALGYGTEAITTNADTHTSTIADGATDPVRAMFVKYTGSLDSACTITIAPNTVNRMHFIENGTSGSQNIIISQGSGANITIPPGDTKAVYLDGAGSGAAVVDAFASLSVVDLKVQDDLTVTDDATIGGTLGVTGIVTLTDDLIIGDGKTIGSASDVDAITIAANGQLTLTQTLIGTALDISGDIDVDGTANLDIVDIDGAVDMASTLQVDGAITSSAAATITTADNSYTLTLQSTDTDASSGPNLRLKRDSSSPADDDYTGIIYFQAENDAGEETDYQRITTRIRDASDGSEDGQLTLSSMVAGTLRNRLEFNEGEAVFNDDSVDVDFRVESNGSTHMLFVNAGDNKVLMSSNPASDTQSTPHDILTLATAYSSSGANGAAGLGPRIVFKTPDDETNPSVGGGIAVVKESADDSDSSAAMTFDTSQNDETLDEAMRINSSGQFLLGTTSNNSDSYKMVVDGGGGSKGIDCRNISYNADNGAFRSVPSGNTTYLFAAMLNSSNSTVGSIVVTSANTTYNTSSDYRLKENVKPLENGLDRLNQLKPVNFNWIESGQEEEGFIAHEVEEVFSYAVTGEKDAVKNDGTVSPQHMDYGRITPLLVKAIQEQQEQIEQLKTEIQTLKGE